MVKIIFPVDEAITSISGTDPIAMSDGAISYRAIKIETNLNTFLYTVDINTDQIIHSNNNAATLQDKFYIIENLKFLNGHSICNYWTCINSNEYKDVFMFSTSAHGPSVGFMAEASQIFIFLTRFIGVEKLSTSLRA